MLQSALVRIWRFQKSSVPFMELANDLRSSMCSTLQQEIWKETVSTEAKSPIGGYFHGLCQYNLRLGIPKEAIPNNYYRMFKRDQAIFITEECSDLNRLYTLQGIPNHTSHTCY